MNKIIYKDWIVRIKDKVYMLDTSNLGKEAFLFTKNGQKIAKNHHKIVMKCCPEKCKCGNE